MSRYIFMYTSNLL